MNKRKTIIQGMQSIQLKYLSFVLIVCFALNALFRKHLTGIDAILDIILGSLPNFIAVLVISLIISDQKKVVGIYKYIITLTITSLLVVEEFFPTFTGNKIFDLYDILASILGGLFAIILTLFYNGNKLSTTKYKPH